MTFLVNIARIQHSILKMGHIYIDDFCLFVAKCLIVMFVIETLITLLEFAAFAH